ncbi:interferon regulatory factor 7 isoform X3 [Stegostoma tigrinum]|uniref:interferon regulatory factor 7 isoform X3 n=1 Tax=Stegostoma tigrinum TaxID=3053191 RepID=UPI00202B128B|nr:interferon regulatory factor 7 isoform X3 [Stegostoma tigrinum]
MFVVSAMGKQRMNNQKPQLRSWLIAQINSGSYHGLRWLNKEKTMFRIPWKHAGRQDLCENDYSIFKGWATVSGKCTDGPPKWKANFRCALNNIDSFSLLEDNSKESSDPHKIYAITNQKISSAVDPNMDGALQEDDNLESQLHINPETNLEQPNFALHCSAMFHPQGQLEEWIPEFDLMNLSDSAEVLRDFDLTIYYRGKEVFQSTVSNAYGCRLYHDEENERFTQLQQIRFPSTEEIKDRQQKKFTNCLLSNMAGGLLLESKNGDLFAKRLGKCQVFWTGSGASMNEESKKLNRDEEIKLFSLKDFFTEYMEFMLQEHGMPQSSIFLCFGQQFRIGNEKKKLILVKIVPKICICLIEYAHQEGASSLNSENVSLQISNNSNTSSMENLIALIQELESIMEVE